MIRMNFLQIHFHKIVDYCGCSHLMLNVAKSQHTIFRHKSRRVNFKIPVSAGVTKSGGSVHGEVPWQQVARERKSIDEDLNLLDRKDNGMSQNNKRTIYLTMISPVPT